MCLHAVFILRNEPRGATLERAFFQDVIDRGAGGILERDGLLNEADASVVESACRVWHTQ